MVWGELPRRRQNSSLRGLQQFLLSLLGHLGRSKRVKWRGARRKGCISGLTELRFALMTSQISGPCCDSDIEPDPSEVCLGKSRSQTVVVS